MFFLVSSLLVALCLVSRHGFFLHLRLIERDTSKTERGEGGGGDESGTFFGRHGSILTTGPVSGYLIPLSPVSGSLIPVSPVSGYLIPVIIYIGASPGLLKGAWLAHVCRETIQVNLKMTLKCLNR